VTGPGRNDPCPCGSGKKFKHCCLARAQTATGITPRHRTEAFEALLKFSRREAFDPIVEASALDWADLPQATVQEALESILEFESSTQAFFDWLFYDVPADPTRTIAGAFLAAREWTVSRAAADYIRLMSTTSLRLYQVRGVTPGTGLTIRDLWTKEDRFITERLGSARLVRWDVLAARVVHHTDDTHQFEGAILALPPEAAKPLLKELKAEHRAFVRSQPDATIDDFFRQSAPLLHDAWFDEVALREPPALVTTEGDPITASTMVFDVPAAGTALVSLLREADFEGGDLGCAIWIEGTGERKRILGQVACEKGTLTLTTFSKARAARGRQRLESILGPLTVRSEEHREFDPHTPRDDGPEPETIDVDTVPELKAWLQDQDRQWLDTSVPALDGHTPREAAADPRLRPRLRELLVHIENQEARVAGPSGARDLTWIWKELRLRRT